MLHSTKTAFKNELLQRMPEGDLALLKPHLQRVELNLKTVLHRSGAPIEFIFFPEHCIASLVAKIRRGVDAEVGTVGFEGMIDTPVVMGDDRQRCDCVVQSPGDATKVPAIALVEAMAVSPTLRPFLVRYAQSLTTQTAFTALANARFRLEQRLARWLLMFHDRVDGDELAVTHESLSVILGVRRPGVTVAIQILEGKGVIRANRGAVIIRDREGLIELSNGSYGVPEREYERLFGKIGSRAGPVNHSRLAEPRRMAGSF